MLKLFSKIIFLFLIFNLGFADKINSIVATVGDEIITEVDLVAMAKTISIFNNNVTAEKLSDPNFKKEILKLAIEKKIVLGYAKDFSIEPPPYSILKDKFISARGISSDQLNEKLLKADLSQKEFADYLKQEFIAQQAQQRYVSTMTKVDNEKAHKYIETYMHQNTKVHLLDFYLPKSAGKVSAKKFESLVGSAVNDYKSGVDVSSPMVLNDLGTRNIDDIPTLFTNVVLNLKPGVPSYMVIADNGYHSLFLLSKDSPEPIDLSQAKQHLMSIEAMELYPKFLDELRESTYVSIN